MPFQLTKASSLGVSRPALSISIPRLKRLNSVRPPQMERPACQPMRSKGSSCVTLPSRPTTTWAETRLPGVGSLSTLTASATAVKIGLQFDSKVAWSGAMLTDSAGFQVFSLTDLAIP